MGREYVGIDFHRRRSVVVRVSESGERLAVTRIENTPAALTAAVAVAGDHPEVVIEATYGWYWAVDALQELGARVHLANPNALNWGERRVKNDIADATDLADMLRLGRLPEAWIAPPALRELRELVRYRVKLVQLRSGLKAQVHAVMAKEGVLPTVVDMFGPAGRIQLDQMGLGENYSVRVESLRDLIEVYDREIVMLERRIHQHLRHDRGYQAVQAINGVGSTIAAIIVAEVGDVHRFATPRHLCSWAGLTPGRRESDRKGHDTGITKMACGAAGLVRRFGRRYWR
jgi:transposase